MLVCRHGHENDNDNDRNWIKTDHFCGGMYNLIFQPRIVLNHFCCWYPKFYHFIYIYLLVKSLVRLFVLFQKIVDLNKFYRISLFMFIWSKINFKTKRNKLRLKIIGKFKSKTMIYSENWKKMRYHHLFGNHVSSKHFKQIPISTW